MSAKQYGIPTPIQFDRLYAGPLDKHEVFESYSEALTYAQGPISYPGQTIGVKKSGLKEDVYVINQDKSLSRLMIQREDIRVVLKKDNWIGECPYEQTISIPYLEPTDNCIISLGESVNDPEVVRQIVNAKIGDTIQEEGSIKFIARGDIPNVDIPIIITIGSVVSAVEIPNNVNDNTNHTVVIAKKDAWKGDKPPYTQDLYVFGVRPDSNGTIGINPDSSYAQINKMAAATAGVVRYEQKNNYVTIAAMNSKPSRDLEILVVWGDEIVVFENSDTLEDFNTTVDLVLKANEWSTNIPYTQTVIVDGLSEYHTGAIGLSDNCTPEQAEIGLNAGLELIEQGNGYIVVRANDIKPIVDLPIYLTYGSNITIVPSPEYVGEANRHVDTLAYASKWVKSANGWDQEVDVQGITSNSIGTMGLVNGATELQAYTAATARIKIAKVYDNKVLLTATRVRPHINLPLCFVFGRNINVAKYPGVIGKVSLDTNYIIFDDTLIKSGLSTLQQLLEYLQREKVNYDDIIDNLTSTEKRKPLSANMGRELNEKIDITRTELEENIEDLRTKNAADHSSMLKSINLINEDLNQTVIRIQQDTPVYSSKYGGENRSFNILWIKADNKTELKKYTVIFRSAEGSTGLPDTITENITIPCSIPLTEPVRPGYKFLYWNNGVTNILPGTLYTENTEKEVTFNAVWEPEIYKVTLNDQDAGVSGIGMIYYKYTEPVFYSKLTPNSELDPTTKLENLSNYLPEKLGYTFTGYWKNIDDTNADNKYIDENGIFKVIEGSPNVLYNIIGNSTIYAGWSGDTYTIDFNGAGGTLPDIITPKSALRGMAINIPLNYIPSPRPGYQFLGWSDIETDIEPRWKPGDDYTKNETATLYAVWKYIAYEIIIKDKDDNDVYNTTNILYHRYNEETIYANENCTDIVLVVPVLEKEGLAFNGYFDKENGNGTRYIDNAGNFEDRIYRLSDNITLYSYLGEIIYIVDFELNGGTFNINKETFSEFEKYFEEDEETSEIKLKALKGPYNSSHKLCPIIPTKTLVDEISNKEYPQKFIGWKDYSIIPSDGDTFDKSILQPGTDYTIIDDNTLYAQWESIVTITLVNGDNIERVIYNIFDHNEFYSDPDCTDKINGVDPLTNSGYTFMGYFAKLPNQEDEKQYITETGAFSDLFYQDNTELEVTLIAKWQ